MEILDLQQHSLEFLDDVHNQSLIDRIFGGDSTPPQLILAGTTSAFLVANFGGNFATSANSSSFTSISAGNSNSLTVNVGSVISITATKIVG